MNRTLYIGDIHGCADEFEQIISDFGYVSGSDILYQTGDIINKGPDTIRSLKIVKKLGILTVMGNHEARLLQTLNAPENTWTEKERLRLGPLSLEDRAKIRIFVSTWPLWRDTPHALLVHAGLEPGKTELRDMSPDVLLSIRLWNGRPWFEQIKWDKPVVFGHWAKMGFVKRPGFIGLDSGCVYGKELTAWCPEEDRFYTVTAKRIYCQVNKKALPGLA